MSPPISMSWRSIAWSRTIRRVGADVRRARRVLDEPREIRQPAGRLELPEALQVLADGDGIGRLVALDERRDRAEDQPVIGAVEILGA